jgi:hypothetical protein
MSEQSSLPETEPASNAGIVWMDRLTGLVLLLVIVAVAWMVCVSVQPKWLRLDSVEIEAVLMLSLLTAALILVSVVALLHTRNSAFVPDGTQDGGHGPHSLPPLSPPEERAFYLPPLSPPGERGRG